MTAAAFAAAVALSMLAFALLGARRDPDAETRRSHFLMGAGDFFIHWFLWLLSPAERLALALGWSPIAFNFLGLAVGAVAGVLLALGHLVSGAWAILACGVLDILDARVAAWTGRAPGTLLSWVAMFIGVATFLTAAHRTWWIAARLKPPS